MANTERMSISVAKERAESMRKLVESGAYPSLSSAFDAAADALVAQEALKAAWWQETLRRFDEAERNPERLMDIDSFFRGVHEDIEQLKKGKGVR